jgi:hypothetical protein
VRYSLVCVGPVRLVDTRDLYALCHDWFLVMTFDVSSCRIGRQDKSIHR